MQNEEEDKVFKEVTSMDAKQPGVFARRASGLVRELSIWDVVIWTIASPAASGMLYYMVAESNKYPGGSAFLAFLIGAIIILPIVLTLAQILQIMPRSGGMYVIISRILDPSLGFLGSALYVFGEGMAIGVMAWVGTGVLGSAFDLAGSATHSAGLAGIGSWLGLTSGRTIISIILVIAFWLVSLVSMKAVKNLTRVLFVIPMVCTLIFAIVAFTIKGNPQSAWNNTWGPGVYQNVLNAARGNGWHPSSFSWSSTFSLLLVVFWAFVGWESITFAAGEVKNPKRSLFSGLLAGFLAVTVIYLVVAWATWVPFIKDQFISAYTFLYDTSPAVLKTIMPLSRPSVPLFLGSLIPSPWLAIVLIVGVSFWFYNTIPPVLVATSRAIFAMSFDRSLPKTFSNVNSRGVPTVATHIAMIFGLLAILVFARNVTLILAMLDVTTLFIFWLLGISAILLPFRRPDIYKLSPIQRNFLGLPVITWLGLWTTAVGLFFVFFAGAEMTTPSVAILCAIIFIMYLLHIISQKKAIDEGIDVSKTYSEIPPE